MEYEGSGSRSSVAVIGRTKKRTRVRQTRRVKKNEQGADLDVRIQQQNRSTKCHCGVNGQRNRGGRSDRHVVKLFWRKHRNGVRSKQ